jgi:hypothetical protein
MVIVIMGCLFGRTIIAAAVNESFVLMGKQVVSRSLVVAGCPGLLERAKWKARLHRQ